MWGRVKFQPLFESIFLFFLPYSHFCGKMLFSKCRITLIHFLPERATEFECFLHPSRGRCTIGKFFADT